MKKPSEDEAGVALNKARKLAGKGDYAGALERHVWFHNNALALRPSYYGVRLSFALADWVKLGKKYPPALDKLTSIRNEAVSSLLRGDKNRGLFGDATAINHYLGDSKATVGVFKQIASADPGFASSVYDLAEPALVENKEYGLAMRYMGDPAERLAKAEQDFEEGMKYAQTSGNIEVAQRSHHRIFVEDTVRIIAVLKENGDTDRARAIQAAALRILDDPSIINAVH
jgi:hypothetical protein